jgi:predicted metal-dependent HD superfamily phosphohydrolase
MPLEGRHKTGAWEALDAGYTESHRAYHTWEHVAGLLEKLSEFSDLSTRSDIIAVSVFWHDVVYRTQNQDGSPRPDYENVRDSGELFRQYTLLNNSDSDAVHDLIMATANHLQARAEKQYYPGFAGDLDLFLDLDLSSLASPWEEFVEDLARIRTEFSWAPEVVFCSSQLRILENFAKDDVRLYRRAETSEKWRDAARANLKRCITELQKRIAGLSSG